jgi:hypothetical protein
MNLGIFGGIEVKFSETNLAQRRHDKRVLVLYFKILMYKVLNNLEIYVLTIKKSNRT